MKILGWITVSFTYLLMVWGNTVSATGSGLACPDWPLCHGTITPPARTDIILEWGHRTLAFITSIFILTTVFLVIKNSKKLPKLSQISKSLVALLIIQIVLGGITVLLELSILASTIHLITATLIFSILIVIALIQTFEQNDVILDTNPKLRRLTTAALFGLLVQFILGALVRHGHAGLACPFFPNCMESFLPIPASPQSILAFTHRWWGIAMSGVFIQILILSYKKAPRLKKIAHLVLFVTIAQILLGIITVTSGLNTELRAIHAALGYGLWGITFYFAIRSGSLSFLWLNKKKQIHAKT